MAGTVNVNDLVNTRLTLHAIAENLLAGPQLRESETVRLTVTPSGFSTIRSPQVRYESGRVLHADLSAPVDGMSLTGIGDALSLAPASPASVYEPVAGLTWDAPLTCDAASAALIITWFNLGVTALDALTQEVSHVLWPEHFDAAIAWGEVNYGVSPGDDFHPTPYAYVGPWSPREGAFWNAPFGALLPSEEAATTDELLAFFEEGRRLSQP